jgi:hypothetical protein
MRELLAEALKRATVLDPSHDEFIDPAGAVGVSLDVERAALRLLEAIPAERAERILLEARFEKPHHVMKFPRRGLSMSLLERIAALHVALQDLQDDWAKATLKGTVLTGYGPEFGLALRAVLADIRPKKAYLELAQVLDPVVFAELAKCLEPSKPRKR